tara:strand:- start:285 stop:1655 length:1371 start_codon:yes stop_codon:yes gene_type:complete
MSDRPDIIIADFLKYNEYALDELKETSPEIDKAVSDVIGAIFQKYAVGTGGKQTTPNAGKSQTQSKEGKVFFSIAWSEGTSKENVKCKNLSDVQTEMIKNGMTSTPNSTYTKTKVEVFAHAGNGYQELDYFRIDVGKAPGDYNYEAESLQSYMSINMTETLQGIMEYSGFSFPLSQNFYTELKDSALELYNRSGAVLALIYIKAIKLALSFGPDSTSKYKDMYTYKVDVKMTDGVENLFIGNNNNVMSFSTTDIDRLRDGEGVDVPAQTKNFFENLNWSTGQWKQCKIVALEQGKSNNAPQVKKSNEAYYPNDIPEPDRNTGNRKGPTQSASEYIQRIENFNYDLVERLREGQKVNDAEFVVLGNDKKSYTLSLDKNGVARWAVADITKAEIDKNIENANSGYDEENLESMSDSQLKDLLRDKKEALTVFEPSEPEYVNLEIEIDDIEEELDNRAN